MQTSTPHSVHRTPGLIRRGSSELYRVVLAMSGNPRLEQGGRAAQLRPGEFRHATGQPSGRPDTPQAGDLEFMHGQSTGWHQYPRRVRFVFCRLLASAPLSWGLAKDTIVGVERYVIRGGREGYERLQLLARDRWPDTSALFERAGLGRGMRCIGGPRIFQLWSRR